MLTPVKLNGFLGKNDIHDYMIKRFSQQNIYKNSGVLGCQLSSKLSLANYNLVTTSGLI